MEWVFKLQPHELSGGRSDEPDAIGVLGIVARVVGGGHVPSGVRVVDVDVAPTSCQETQ